MTEWVRVTERTTGGRTVYWNRPAPKGGLRLAVSRLDLHTGGSPWKFSAYRMDGNSTGGTKVHESAAVGSVAQARNAAEEWLTARVHSNGQACTLEPGCPVTNDGLHARLASGTDLTARTCQDVRGTRWDPNGHYECTNRPRWQDRDGQLFCGRHIRHRTVTPWPG